MTSGQTEETLYKHGLKRCFSSQKLLASQKVAKAYKTLTQKYFSHVFHLAHEGRVRHVLDRSFSLIFHPASHLGRFCRFLARTPLSLQRTHGCMRRTRITRPLDVHMREVNARTFSFIYRGFEPVLAFLLIFEQKVTNYAHSPEMPDLGDTEITPERR